MVKKIVSIFLLSLVLAACALGITADELYDRAAQKYLTGDLEGAQSDLARVLELSPTHDKARELLSEVRRDLGRTAPAAPPATLAPAPAPRPTPPTLPVYKEIKKAIKKAAPAKPQPAPPQFIYQKVEAPAAGLTLSPTDLLWILAALVVLLYLVLRFVFLYVKQEIEKRQVQVCTECKYANPGSAEFCGKCGARLKPWTGITAAQRKWYAKFNWKKNPFTLDIMPKLFTGYQTQVATIFERVNQKTGHILVMGDKGVGKTTLLKWLADSLSKEFHTVYIPRPTDNFDDLLEYLAKQLKIKVSKGEKITIYDLEALASKTNVHVLLLLDEAHEFNPEFERPLRSLGDLNGINFILAGLPEAADKIKRDSPPFFDRIISQVVLQHLSLEETTELIRKRIEDAGGSGLSPFTPEAIENIFKMTHGVPRSILKVCDWVVVEAIHNNLECIQVSETTVPPEETLAKESKEGEAK